MSEATIRSNYQAISTNMCQCLFQASLDFFLAFDTAVADLNGAEYYLCLGEVLQQRQIIVAMGVLEGYSINTAFIYSL